jgi:hypothetical protein
VAQRLVYRRPARQLQIHTAGGQEHKPGTPVKMSVTVADESGKPLPATLGVCVLDESSLPAHDAGSSSLLGYFLLGSQLEHEAKNLNFYLSQDPKAAVALDLLLGTQGRWPSAGPEAKRSGEENDAQSNRFAASLAATSPPAAFDNLAELQQRYKDSLESYRADRTRRQNSLTMASFFGGLGLVLFVAMLAIMNVPTGLRLWVPALSAATACAVIGAILMNPERLQSISGHLVAFAPFSAAPSPMAVAADDAPTSATLPSADDQRHAELRYKGKAPPNTLARKDKSEEKAQESPADSLELKAAPAAASPAPPSSVVQSIAGPNAAPTEGEPPPAPAKMPPLKAAGARAKTNGGAGKSVSAYGGQAPGLSAPEPSRERLSANRPAALKAGRGLEVDQRESAQFYGARQSQQWEQPNSQQAQRSVQAPEVETGVLLWNPLLVTGEDGRAELHFDLPADATKYRIVVDAYAAGRLGSVQVDVPSQSP